MISPVEFLAEPHKKKERNIFEELFKQMSVAQDMLSRQEEMYDSYRRLLEFQQQFIIRSSTQQVQVVDVNSGVGQALRG